MKEKKSVCLCTKKDNYYNKQIKCWFATHEYYHRKFYTDIIFLSRFFLSDFRIEVDTIF